MADIIVTRAVLEDSAGKLSAIKTEFEHANDRSGEDSDVWGASPVASAMQHFAGDWSIHRGKISVAITDLHKKLEDMTVAWNDTERSLAESLTTETV